LFPTVCTTEAKTFVGDFTRDVVGLNRVYHALIAVDLV
jgi:hypothetical protein